MNDPASQSAQAPSQSAAVDAPLHVDDQRVSVLVGDRLCTRCGYNLVGQHVWRERHYQMLIVRCPERGAVASVQEYPLLGRWAGRWGALFAAIWFIVLILIWPLSSMALTGLAFSATEFAVRPFATHMAELQYQWSQQKQLASGNPMSAYYFQRTADAIIDPTWWATVNQAELADQRMVGWSFLWVWLSWLVPLVAIGCFWATALLHLGRARLTLAACAIAGLAALFTYLFSTLQDPLTALGSWTGATTVARQLIGQPLLCWSLVYGFVVLCVGMWIGRTVVRLAVRMLLPPRACSALALLWTADGLQPPSTTAGRKARID